MKTLLVAINAKYIHTNLALRYLYTYCKDEYTVDFVEFTIKEQKEQVITEILNYKPDLIGFSCYIWNIEYIKEIIKDIHQTYPNIKLLLGGPETSYEVGHFFDILPIDYIISGEGEYPFKQLLHRLEANLSLADIPGIHYRQHHQIISTENNFVIDLNQLPTPYRIDRDLQSLGKRILYIESSRGCPFRCSYCLASLEKHVRFFDIEFIKQELTYLMKNGAKTFKFLDRTFNVRKDYALEMFEFIIKNHQEHCVFQFEITGDLLDEEIIAYLNKNAPKGLIRFEIGIQSTNEYTNRLILRKQNFNQLAHNIQLIQAGDKIDLHLDLIAGLPKEDYASFTKTFNDVFRLKPRELQLGFLKMLRGTKMRKEAHLYQYQYHEEAPYEIIEHSDLSKEDIRRIHLAEDILEKYYNSHRFDNSVNYILETYFKNNEYAFFAEFGLFYDANFNKIDYQYHDLCLRLFAFIDKKGIKDDLITDLVIYDYLEKQKTKPKIWYLSKVSKEEKHAVFNHIVSDQLIPVNLDHLYRYALVERLSIHPQTLEKQDCYLIKLFMPTNNRIYVIRR